MSPERIRLQMVVHGYHRVGEDASSGSASIVLGPRQLLLVAALLVAVMVALMLSLTCWRSHQYSAPAAHAGCPEEGVEICRALTRAKARSFTALGRGRKLQYSVGFQQIVGNNVFFVKGAEVLSAEEGCAVESALRLLPDRSVFVIELSCTGPKDEDDYLIALHKLYRRLFVLRISGELYFKDTPLDGHWQPDDDLVMFAAMALAVWRFGGSALDLEVLLNSRNLFDSCRARQVFADSRAILARDPCNAFVYGVISKTLAAMIAPGQERGTREAVFLAAVADFCGGPEFEQRGCPGVVPLVAGLELTTNTCVYVCSDQLGEHSDEWLLKEPRFCPHVGKMRRDQVEKATVSDRRPTTRQHHFLATQRATTHCAV